MAKKKVEEQPKKLKEKLKEGTKKQFKFWTANSKKVTLAMIFLISVIVDETLLNNLLYTEDNLFGSNLFKGILATIAVITVNDVKGLVNRWIDK